MKKVLFGLGVLGVLASCTVSQTIQLTGEPIGTKTGVAKSKIIGNSDTSIKAATDNGGIKVIGAVEVTTKVYLIFPVIKTTVYGN